MCFKIPSGSVEAVFINFPCTAVEDGCNHFHFFFCPDGIFCIGWNCKPITWLKSLFFIGDQDFWRTFYQLNVGIERDKPTYKFAFHFKRSELFLSS